MRNDLDAGLREVLAVMPVGTGYLAGMVGATTQGGPWARAEAGYHPLAPVALFGFAEATREGAGGGVGVRVVFP